jgi:hypothetical protein
MIRITRDTFQKLLLSELSKVSSQKGDLVIHVVSQPLFLSTSIAFKIFDYQLRNYPRRVVWKTEDPKTLTPSIQKHLNFPLKNQQSETSERDQEKKSYNFLSVVETLEEENAKQSRPQLSLQSVFDDHHNNPQTKKPENSHKSLQDLDSWLDRIEATKSALNSMKSDVFHGNESQSKTSSQSFSFLTLRPKGFSFISTFFVMALIVASLVIFFPVSSYTLEVRPARKTASMNFIIPQSSFVKQENLISFESKVLASGISPTQSERATGTVDIVNKTSKPLLLSNGGFRLVNEDKTYIHLRNTTISDTLTVPPQNEKTPLSLTVQSADIGQEYGVPAGTVFDIVDANGAKPCSSCFAVATTALQGQTPGNQKVISEADHLLLRSNIEGGIAQKRLEVLREIKQNKKALTDSTWYRNNSSTFTFNKEVGEVATEVNLKADVNTTTFYLPFPVLENLLKRENKDISSVDQVDLLDSSAKFQEDSNSDTTIKISYRYSLSIDIDNEKIKSTLSTDDFTASQTSIKRQYSSVANITKYDTGIRVPGIKPAVNVKIITLKD